jgi:hypothetical protein
MTAFSPVDAAFEGLRVMRREPKAVMAWIGVWALVLAAFGIMSFVLRHAGTPTAHSGSFASVLRRFGPLAVAFVPSILVCWAATTTAAYRAVLTPTQKGWAYLRLGGDEFRLAILTAVAWILAPIAASLITYLLIVAAGPLMAAAPTMAMDTALIGAISTVIVLNWIFVRLWLIAVETFDEGRFHLTAYWPLTHGYFWRLFASYVLVTLLCFFLGTVLVLAALWVADFAQAVAAHRGEGIAPRGLLWALLPVTAVLGAALPVVLLTMVCACQAYAYRAIAPARTIH